MKKKITICIVLALLYLALGAMAQKNSTLQRPKPTDTIKKTPKRNLQDTTFQLQQVEVNTGYQTLSRERAIGSFTLVDSTLLNRTLSTNILDRLDGVTSGLLFNRGKTQAGQSDFNIRGRSTINGEDRPLIIVDSFPYEGEIENINPNDIKTINILKDAAAASIWGTRAGNGVVVITTFKGNYGAKQQFNLTTNLTVGQKPDFFQVPWFSSAEWIDLEKFIYDKGGYTTAINNGYAAISPAVEIFEQAKKKKISPADSLRLINSLKQYDVRNDMLEYLYRPSINQQYAMNINGGSGQNKYFVSAGYDNNLNSQTTDSYNRFTLTANNSYRLLNNKMEINIGLMFTSSNSKSGETYSPLSPYEQLADEQGNPLAVRNFFRLAYIDTVGKGRLLDWHYRPLDENDAKTQNKLTSYIINAGVNYAIITGLKASLLYQYQKQQTENRTHYDENSYHTRGFINRTSSIGTTGTVNRVIPLGDIERNGNTQFISNYARLQLDFDRSIAADHGISAIGGFEIRNNYSESLSQILYGYDKSIGLNANSSIDFTKDYPLFYNTSTTTRIDPGQNSSYLLDRYISYYANASYAYKIRYVLSLSARKDESNLFGVKPNQKGVPLWSAGLAWHISKETFYNIAWLPDLKLRSSFGYAGNVSKSISAYLTATAIGPNIYGSQFSMIVNPPNPSLKWERVKMVNVGLDFATKNHRISGSLEPYLKYGMDLFGTSQLAPQTGMLNYQGNFANTFTKGLDITLNTTNINRSFKWYTTVLFSTNRNKVTKYTASQSSNSNIINQSYNNPIEGNPYFAIYAYKWARLDDKGDPQVYLNGSPSKVYANINNSLDRNNLRLMGSAVPITFGSVRNTFTYKGFDLSFNITYRLNYFFRRTSLDNASIYTTTGFQSNVDYDKRWQKAGDENTTSVPALVYPNVAQRSTVYRYADILVEKADNIMLQDMRLGWKLKASKYLSNLQLYTYIRNLGYLWKANKYGIDPDRPRTGLTNTSVPMTLAFGLKTTL